MVQLWVNLPSKDKMSAPKYQAIENTSIPKVLVDNGYVEVIAGTFNGLDGIASTFTPIHLFNAHLQAGGKTVFSFPANYNTCLIVVEGEIKVNDSDEWVNQDHFVLFENEGEKFQIEANEKSIVLILSGEPIHEPIAAHGPFVMNTRQEIMQAFHDFEAGKFGVLD
jgi:redox-sensitive bicupin YhaK (pirin superfamily)